MGWTYQRTDKGAAEVCREEFGGGWFNQDGNETKRLADAMVGTTYYAAMETRAPGSCEVWALVVLTDVRHNASLGGRSVGLKVMDETCGPVESRAPLSILRLLTPTQSEWARQWRERCYRHAGIAPEQVELGGFVPADGVTHE